MASLRISKFRDRDLRPLFPCKPVALLAAVALRCLLASTHGPRLIAAGIPPRVEDQPSGLRFGGNPCKLFRAGVIGQPILFPWRWSSFERSLSVDLSHRPVASPPFFRDCP